jgi:hypothetical protein
VLSFFLRFFIVMLIFIVTILHHQQSVSAVMRSTNGLAARGHTVC